MAKTQIIATALLNTSKGKFEPGEAVKGLPGDEMKLLRKFKAVKQVILEPDASIEGDKSPQNNAGGSSGGGQNGGGAKTPPKTDPNGDK